MNNLNNEAETPSNTLGKKLIESPALPAHQAAWMSCLTLIRDNIKPQSYRTWFEPIKPIKLESSELSIQVPSQFFYEWLEEHYFGLLKKALHQVIGPDAKLLYSVVVEEQTPTTPQQTVQLARQPQAPSQPPVRTDYNTPLAVQPPMTLTPATSSMQGVRQPYAEVERSPNRIPSQAPGVQSPLPANSVADSYINPRYTFDNFIKGDCNQLARAAAFAVADRPGSTSFNPLLIYGGVGLGKTHLIQAIGNAVRERGKAKQLLYVSSEKFTIEFVNAIQNNRISEFSAFYRGIDLLIVDDIQFFAGKEKTQEEFFHIFNTLHQAGKQIVLSSDRSPRELKGLEERLLSRFQWGLTADLQLPDLETRIAILNKRATDDGIELPQDVTEFVAANVTSNVRELEGSLIRLLAQSSLTSQDITIQLARNVLKDLIDDAKLNVTIDTIQRVVSEFYNLPAELLRAKTRKQEIVQARQAAMYLSKELTGSSLKTIGAAFGGRDHSTVIHACQCVVQQLVDDPQYREQLGRLRRKIETASY